jgi:site-specific DNA-cytosine methylase
MSLEGIQSYESSVFEHIQYFARSDRMTIYYLSYFCGGGGAAIAAKQLGYKTFGIDFDPEVAEIYKNNVGEIMVADLATVNPQNIPIPTAAERRRNGDILIWQLSPPCQEYSKANNKKNHKSDRATILDKLHWHFDYLQPDAVWLENVTDYEFSRPFQDFVKFLNSRNFICHHQVLNAADFGVPQSRERLILRAWKQEFGFLPPVVKTHSKNPEPTLSLFGDKPLSQWVGWYESVKDLLPTLPTVTLTDRQRDAIAAKFRSEAVLVDSDNASSTKSGGHKTRTLLEPSFVVTAGMSRPKVFLVDSDNQNSKGYTTKTGGEPSFTCTTGMTRPKAVLVQRIGSSKKLCVRNKNEPVWTITAGLAQDDKGNSRNQLINSWIEGDVRSLNTQAIARLQSFPDYIWTEKFSTNIRAIGNAVPPMLAHAIIKSFGF